MEQTVLDTHTLTTTQVYTLICIHMYDPLLILSELYYTHTHRNTNRYI